ENFAGGGGASSGIEAALGRPVDVAINHDAEAIAMHKANHPATRHFCQSIHSIDPQEACTVDGRVRPVLLAWFSPDCKHFSKAKGGKPVEKRIRDLAWVVIHWVERLGPKAPQIIMLENVEEFRTWGPLGDDDRPCPKRKGETFDLWVRRLRKHGYEVEWRELRACDYGAPTIRKRLFLIARRDGKPIVWPEPTHGPDRGQPWRPASDIIDWSIPCPSIFERDRPLAEATCRRIAAGIKRYVVDEPEPFIVPVCNSGWNQGRTWPASEPLRTITTAKGGEFAIASPTLIQTGYGERPGQAPRVPGLEKPLGTIVSGGGKHALVAAFMAQHNSARAGVNPGRSASSPMGTITGRGTQQQLVTSNLVKLRGTSRDGQPVSKPLHTVSAGGTHFAEVRAFMVKYFSEGGQWGSLDHPLGTVTTRDRFGLVTVSIGGMEYAICDIGMRMLTARELFNAQGFAPDYIIDLERPDGKPLTKTAKVRMCGNSVSPVHPESLVRANLSEASATAKVAA
ncbi:MAG: DNA cytosine methyltransferase, partial [Erythrobacter sp.]